MRTRVVIVIVVLLTVSAGWWVRFREPAEKTRPVVSVPAAQVVKPEVAPVAREVMAALPPETESERLERLKGFGDIPREKLPRVRSILRDYAELEQKLREENRTRPQGTETLRTMWQASILLNRERRADLEKILTPQEAEDCEMHVSQPGQRVIESSKEIAISDDERRALFRLQSAFYDEYGRSGSYTSTEVTARENARVATYDHARLILGEERFAAYLLRDDPAYKFFREITEQQGQPAAIADQLWRIKSEYLIRRAAGAPESGSNVRTQVAQHAALKSEIIARVTAMVGETTLRERTTAFQWLAPIEGALSR